MIVLSTIIMEGKVMDSRSLGRMCNILIKKIMFLIVAALSDFCASYFMDFLLRHNQLYYLPRQRMQLLKLSIGYS